MNLERAKCELEYHAALMRVEKLDIKKVQEIFDILMNEGVFEEEFIDIAYPKSNYLVDFISSFESALHKINCNIPVDIEVAVWVILKYHIRSIASGNVDPLDGLKSMMNDTWFYNFGEHAKEFVGDTHGIEYLTGWYWGYDDILTRQTEMSFNGKYGEEAVIEVKNEVLKAAKVWLVQYD